MKNLRAITYSHDTRVRFFWTLISIAGVAVALYIYAIFATIQHTASRESLLSQSQTLTAKVSELEYQDIALRNTLSLDVALSRGFTEVTKPLYVTRGIGVLTLNTVSR